MSKCPMDNQHCGVPVGRCTTSDIVAKCLVANRGRSLMVKPLPSKQITRVRFSSPAPLDLSSPCTCASPPAEVFRIPATAVAAETGVSRHANPPLGVPAAPAPRG